MEDYIRKGKENSAGSIRYIWRMLLAVAWDAGLAAAAAIAAAIWSGKKQVAFKKPFPTFHLLATKAPKLWV